MNKSSLQNTIKKIIQEELSTLKEFDSYGDPHNQPGSGRDSFPMKISYKTKRGKQISVVAKDANDYSRKMDALNNRGDIKHIKTKSLNEQAGHLDYADLVPGADAEFVKFAQDVDDLINEMIEKANDLHKEGSELVKADILGGHDSSVKAAERNRYIMARVGFLKRMSGRLVAAYEELRRDV